MDWQIDELSKKEKALREAGYTLRQTLGDVNRFGWAPLEAEWTDWVTRFSSRAQATNYAYRKIIVLGKVL